MSGKDYPENPKPGEIFHKKETIVLPFSGKEIETTETYVYITDKGWIRMEENK